MWTLAWGLFSRSCVSENWRLEHSLFYASWDIRFQHERSENTTFQACQDVGKLLLAENLQLVDGEKH